MSIYQLICGIHKEFANSVPINFDEKELLRRGFMAPNLVLVRVETLDSIIREPLSRLDWALKREISRQFKEPMHWSIRIFPYV